MKRRIAIPVVLALLLALACPALAEAQQEAAETAVTEEELLGVWKAAFTDDLQLLIVPGSYAPLPDGSKRPPLYAEGKWQQGDDYWISYSMPLNSRGPADKGLLNKLLGNTMASVVKVFDALSKGGVDSTNYAGYDYSGAAIGIEWVDDGEYFAITTGDSGSIYPFREDDGSVILYWMDKQDPHIACLELHRVSVGAPSAEALTQAVLRPVIDMAGDARAGTALELMRWASDSRCARMDGAALTGSLREAFAALEPADAQAFKDNYAQISGMALDALGLNPETMYSAERSQPFKDAGLADALEQLSGDTESQRAMEVLNAAIVEAEG